MTDALKSLKERYEFDQAEAEFSAESVQKAEAEYKAEEEAARATGGTGGGTAFQGGATRSRDGMGM